jgi:hypothetical protein
MALGHSNVTGEFDALAENSRDGAGRYRRHGAGDGMMEKDMTTRASPSTAVGEGVSLSRFES